MSTIQQMFCSTISLKYRQFRTIISEYRANNLKYLYNDFAFPTIECPAGCATLINTSRLSFVHLLNYWFPKFISFGANKNKLRGMKKDFFQSTLHLETFVCAPHLEVNVEGFFLEVCDYHSDLSKTLIHLPTSPLGNLLHQQSDRLALLSCKPRKFVPFRVVSFSHTYAMATSKGGFDGISTLQITTSKNYDVKIENLLPNSKALFCKNIRRSQLTCAFTK